MTHEIMVILTQFWKTPGAGSVKKTCSEETRDETRFGGDEVRRRRETRKCRETTPGNWHPRITLVILELEREQKQKRVKRRAVKSKEGLADGLQARG